MALVPGDLTSGEMTFGRLDRLPRENRLRNVPKTSLVEW